jgi:hypothetical protein
MRKRPVLTGMIIIGIIAVFHFLPDSKDDPKERADKQAAISAIRARYGPSMQLMAMNPDPQSLDWIAVPYPMCEAKAANCWDVVSYVDVMPGAEKKTIKSEWVIDLSTGADYPRNTEARMMYSPIDRGIIPASSGGEDSNPSSSHAQGEDPGSSLPDATP